MCTKVLLNKYTASTLFIEIPRYVGKTVSRSLGGSKYNDY